MLSTMVLSKSANTDAGGWWIVHTTATFCSAATVRKKLIMRTALAESTPDVGSSRNRMFGRLTSASATDRRRLLPLDRPRVISLPARVSMKSCSPTARARSSTAARRAVSSRSGRNKEAAYARCSRTVSDAHSVSVCSTYAHVRSYSAGVRGSPLTLMKPVGVPPFCCSVSMFSSVVLPAPEGPRMASTWPDVTSPLMSCAEAGWRRALHRDGVVEALEGEAHLLALHGRHASGRSGGRRGRRNKRERGGCARRGCVRLRRRRRKTKVALWHNESDLQSSSCPSHHANRSRSRQKCVRCLSSLFSVL